MPYKQLCALYMNVYMNVFECCDTACNITASIVEYYILVLCTRTG